MSDPTTIQSPCVLICAIEPESGHCYGCGRTRDEIACWASFTDAERTELMTQLPDRVGKLERRPRRVTRRARLRTENARRDLLDLSSANS